MIAPVELSNEFVKKFFPKAWQAVLHAEWIWGYPIAPETVTLVYNKKLLDAPPPTQLIDLVSSANRAPSFILSGFFFPAWLKQKKQTAKHLTHTKNQMLENELLDFFHRYPTDPHHHRAVRF